MTSRANPEHWTRLCKVMGREDLIDDPRFATPAMRVKNDAELDRSSPNGRARRTKHEAMARSAVPAFRPGAVLDTMELQNDPTFEKRGIMQVMQHKTHEPFKMPSWPVRINGKPPTVKASPGLGEHTGGCVVDLAWQDQRGNRNVTSGEDRFRIASAGGSGRIGCLRLDATVKRVERNFRANFRQHQHFAACDGFYQHSIAIPDIDGRTNDVLAQDHIAPDRRCGGVSDAVSQIDRCARYWSLSTSNTTTGSLMTVALRSTGEQTTSASG